MYVRGAGDVSMKSATTVAKICRIIDELGTRKWLGISDLSRRTALLPSDVHRLLTSLRRSGYVDQDAETKKYQLGVQLPRIGLEACQQNELYERAYPKLVELSQRLGATMHLATFDQREVDVFLIADVNGPAEDRSKGRLGAPEPLHSSALGKVVGSALERSTAARAFKKRGMPRYTRRTITDLPTLERHLEQVRLQGYALDQEECFDGVCCLGCPVIDWTGETIGSISTAMPTSQFLALDESMVAASLKAAAYATMAGRRMAVFRRVEMSDPVAGNCASEELAAGKRAI
jgi:DNA-binding IclR family transcriptional regulator